MNKSIPKVLGSQVLNKQVIADTIGFFNNNLKNSDLKVAKFFLKQSQNYQIIEFPHEYIAKESGVSVSTVKRSIARLAYHGIIQSWFRSHDCCAYLVNDYFKQKSVMSQLKKYFFIFFAITSLYSFPSRELLLIKNDYILERTGTSSALSNKPAAQLLYLPEVVPWVYGTEKGVPNKKLTFEQFEAQFFKKEQYMNNFTEEQLLQLAHYPKETLTYATKMLTKDMAAGKAITNQFAYFKSICERAKTKTPQTGYSQSTNKPSVSVQVVTEIDQEARHHELLDRKTRIINKAISMDIDVNLYTIGELQLLIKGYDVPHTQRQMKMQGIEPEPVSQSRVLETPKIDMNGLDTLQDVFFKLNKDSFPKPTTDKLSTTGPQVGDKTSRPDEPVTESHELFDAQYGEYEEVLD